MTETDHNRHHERRSLHDRWQLSGPPHAAGPFEVEVPGCVHADLIRHGVIDDPFLDTNENDVQWVGREVWTYRTVFSLSAGDTARGRIDLVFDGLDTLATIDVNGHSVAVVENMHRTHRVNIESSVIAGDNDLIVTFRSAELEAIRRREKLGHLPTASFDQPYQYIRKMACAWGWDWGPTLNTAGIWRDVHLELWTDARLGAVRPTATVDDDDRGCVTVQVELDGDATGHAIEAVLTDRHGAHVANQSTPITADVSRATLELDAHTVERWWPHTLGEQPLYRLDVGLTAPDGARLDESVVTIGFRTIEIDTSADPIGSAFTLVVNDVPIFARGVNWIPDDPLVARVDHARYRDRLEDVRDLDADLVRVWGGGIYESDDFYDVCDELGILVWQDFLFACAAYPEASIADEVAAEARDNITRLMPHPSLALWNGNNENFMGWFEWDWQRRLDGRDWGAGLYLDLLPALVEELDPARPYWPGSPYSGSTDIPTTDDRHGCRHLWDVWNQLDYRHYRDHTPRFVSELGWQAPPTRSTIDWSIGDSPLRPDSTGMLHHQKAIDGQEKLSRGLEPFFVEPVDTATWLWAMQLNQARAITTGIEHFRSHRGTCMGTIWWQFNDCWPVTSWSVLDSHGGRKPSYFALQAAYADRIVTIQPRDRGLAVVVVNDSAEPWTGSVAVRRIRFDGTLLRRHEIDIHVATHDSSTIRIPDHVATPTNVRSECLVVDFGDARGWWYFANDRDLDLPSADIDVSVRRPDVHDDSAIVVNVRANTLIRDLTLLPDQLAAGATVDRQLVDLLAGEQVEFTVTGVGLDAAPLLAAAPVLRTANELVNVG